LAKNKLTQSKFYSEVRASASQALKNLNSEGGDGLEEGTVAALIAMSRGATDNSVSNFDSSSMVLPAVEKVDSRPEGKFGLAMSGNDELQPFNFLYDFKALSVVFLKETGGEAPTRGSRGPAAPQPPTMVAEELPTVPVVEEELEQKSEEDGGGGGGEEKVMMFTKMSVPPELEVEEPITFADEEEAKKALEEEGNVGEEAGEEKKEEGDKNKNGLGVEGLSLESLPLPDKVVEPDVTGPKERQAKVRRRRKSIQAKKKKEENGEIDEPFDIQASNMGLY